MDVCTTQEWTVVGIIVTAAVTLAAPAYAMLLAWSSRTIARLWLDALPPRPTGTLLQRVGGWTMYPLDLLDKSGIPVLVSLLLVWFGLIMVPAIVLLGTFGYSAHFICL